VAEIYDSTTFQSVLKSLPLPEIYVGFIFIEIVVLWGSSSAI